MNIVLTPDKYNVNSIYYNDSIKNTVIENSYFIKIMFSNHDLYLNGVYILIDLSNITLEKYYNKYKCILDTDKNKHILNFLYKLEFEILNKYDSSKVKKLIIFNQLKQGNIKLFIEKTNLQTRYERANFVLKISGIWEKDNEIGLTYKFIMI